MDRRSSPELAADRAAVEQSLAVGEAPNFKDKDRWWADFKAWFSATTPDGVVTCAWCGADLYSTGVGTVDHFAPKSGVARKILEMGREVALLPNVEGRRLDGPAADEPPWTGYAWRAYDWDNFVLSCERCNTGWKRILFPATVDGVRVSGAAVRGRDERPLLLNPYDNHPGLHLDFVESGLVLSRTDEGVTTIDVLGLNHREALVRARRATAKRVVRLLREPSPDLGEVVEIGADDRVHAAVVRAVAEHLTGCTWDEIVRAAASPPQDPP